MTVTHALFCHEPGRTRLPDSMFASEVSAAKAAGLAFALIDHDAVIGGDMQRAVRLCPPLAQPVNALYRGWMMRADRYGPFSDALASRGYRLINSADAYTACHHIPASYSLLSGLTPRTVWRPGEPPIALEELITLLAQLSGPVIVKDYVKSEKHAWDEACFIPDASDRDAAMRVIGKFIELRGRELEGGIVLRQFVRLRIIGHHPQSGMPIANEWRSFWLDDRPIVLEPYWEGFEGERPDLAAFAEVASRIPSRFFSMDLAQTEAGAWIVMELGDGQVTSFPERADIPSAYRALAGSASA